MTELLFLLWLLTGIFYGIIIYLIVVTFNFYVKTLVLDELISFEEYKQRAITEKLLKQAQQMKRRRKR